MPAAASNPALLTSAECRPVLPESAAPAQRGRRARGPASRRSIAVLLAVTTALGVGPPPVASARDAGPGPTATGNTYRLAATWTGVPSATEAGRFLGAADVSSLPDRTILVLGRAEGLADGARLPNDLAVHVLAPDGTGLALLPLGNELESAEHLDAGFAQTFFVLGRTARGVWRVLEIGRDGNVVRRIDIDQEGRARDLAASPAGSFYVVKAAPDGGPDRIEIYGNLGQLAGSIVPDRARPGGAGDPYSYSLGRMDVDPGGVLYVMAHADRHCPTATPPPTSAVPTAEPTRRPSLGRGSQTAGRQAKTALDRTASPAQTDCTRERVLVYGPDHRFREALANAYVGDIAVGPSGVFVSSAGRRPPQRIYELRGQRLAYTCSAPEALDVPLPMGASEVRLDVDASGTVLGGTDLGEPFYRGAIAFGDPRQERPSGYRPRALGVYDRPRLGGPTFPRRLDATGALAVLEAPHQTYGPSAIANTHVDVQHDAEAVQRWTLDGRLLGQQVYHDQLLRDGSAASGEYHIVDPLVDVAVDGDDTYMIANQVVWFRPDSLPPTWYQHVPGTHFIAASADDGRVAVLNDAARRVLVLTRSGRVVSDRPIAEDWSDRLASDLALDGDRLYLADEGRGSILVRGLDGTDHGEWPVYDAPRRVSVGAEGDLYVIGRSGYGLRYTADGRLVAHWRVPQRHSGVKVEPTDLAVGDDGRVYVTFVGLAEPGAQAQPPERRAGWDIAAGGVWVFEPSDESVDPLPPPDRPRCTVDADKSAAPGQVTLGEPVTVTLRLEGECPGHHEPQQLMLVMDTSWSMHDLFYPENPTPGALRRAQDVLSALLAAIDPGSVEIGLVTFSDGAQVAVPLPGDLGEVRSKVLTRRADGDTVMGAAVQLAHQELRGAHGRPDRRQTIVVVTDGLFHDQPKQAIDAARADGIEVAVIVMTTQGLDEEARARLVEAIGDPELVFVDPLPETASRLVTRISTWVPSAALLQSAVVHDELPDNMVYVTGSARPAASYEAATRTLRWDLGPAPSADGVVLSYVVVPSDAGLWPTNVRAHAEYRDGSGSDGVTEFPLPRVQVNLPLPTPTPTSSPTVTPSATASTTPTPTSTPRTSWSAYLPIAAQPANCIGKAFHADVVLVLDVSTTMSARTPGGRTKLQAEIDAARLFIRLLVLEGDRRGHDQVAIVAFNDRAWPVAVLTRDEAMAQGSLDGLEAEIREGTRIDLALDEAGRALGSSRRDPDRVVAVVLLTDGRPNRVPTPVPSGGQEQTVLGAADRLKEAGVRIYTIGLGEPEEVWSWLMERIASRPAFYHYSLAGEDLADIYREILGGILCGREG